MQSQSVVIEGIDRTHEALDRLCAIRDLLVAAGEGASDLHLVHPGQMACLLDCIVQELAAASAMLQGDPR